MLTNAAANTNSAVAVYDRSGRALSALRSEPVERIVPTAGQTSTPTENSKDKVTLSPQGLDQSRQASAETSEDRSSSPGDRADREEQNGSQSTTGTALTAEEEKVVQQLKNRDREVKAHEMAHLASAGQYARGGPTYSYQQGPDGRRYAIGGEVPIDLSKEKTPEETIEKMRVIRSAATAPAEPSSTDRSVAAAASALESQARREMQTENTNAADEPTAATDQSESGDEPQDTSNQSRSVPRRAESVDIHA